MVLRAVKKYEKEPDRCNMIDNKMIQMETICSQYQPESLEASLIDWIYLSRFVGYRSIEWCQKTMNDYKKIDHPN